MVARSGNKQELADRLVESPAFIFSSVRSGSTLLRCILNSHSRVFSGHEMHLYGIGVAVDAGSTASAMGALGVSSTELEYMLWDRLLHWQLQNSKKEVIVEKTPANVLHWERIAQCWPKARYIFLLRHPVSIIESSVGSRSFLDTLESSHRSKLIGAIAKYIEAMEEAHSRVSSIKVRYEDLVSNPESTTKFICEYLGVPWEEQMLSYGDVSHGISETNEQIGDWGSKIRSGEIQSSRELPRLEEIPDDMKKLCQALGYL